MADNKNIRDLIKSFTPDDYAENRVNLHIHTTYSDGKGDINDLLKQAKSKSYKYIAFCDHNTMQGYLDTGVQNEPEVISGVEFDVWYKNVFMHLLAYGVDVNNKELQAFCAKTKRETEYDIIRIFAARDLKALIQAIHNAGGIAVLAHPACCLTLNLEKFIQKLVECGLDGLEVYYPYPRWRKFLRLTSQEKIEKTAEKYNLIKTGGTDLHGKTLD